MTPTEIRAAIAADPALQALVPDSAALAAALSVGRTRVVQRLGGVGAVMDALGPDVGAEVLDALDALKATSSPVKWAWVLINRGELDFGLPSTRGVIVQLQQAGAFGEQGEAIAAALLAIAEEPDPVSAAQVELAIRNDLGEIIV